MRDEEITVAKCLTLENPLFIDLRSPSEYQEATIPGAINLPFFNDQERAEIGTIYRQQSPCQARARGLELIAPRLPELTGAIGSYAQDRQVVIFCWRGGERSQAMAEVLHLMRIPFYRLHGGYKAYRRYVLDRLACYPLGDVVVMHGLTGCGKTQIINRLIERGYAAVDLEGLARHRGSVFGSIGMENQPGQKMFDSLLWCELKRLAPWPYLLVECESKRIGNIHLPEHLSQKMEQGRHILVYDTLENRIQRLVQDYVSHGEENIEQLIQGVRALEKHLGKSRVNQCVYLIEKRIFSEVVEYLLVDYYDKLYEYPSSPDKRYELCVNSEDIDEAACAVANYLEAQYGTKG